MEIKNIKFLVAWKHDKQPNSSCYDFCQIYRQFMLLNIVAIFDQIRQSLPAVQSVISIQWDQCKKFSLFADDIISCFILCKNCCIFYSIFTMLNGPRSQSACSVGAFGLGGCIGAKPPQIAKFVGPTWGPPGSCRPQMGPMLAPWNLLSGTPIGATYWGLTGVTDIPKLYSVCAIQTTVSFQ